MPIPTLKGQRIVIIGGSAGIGYAVAECAFAEGAKVTIGSSGAANVEAAVGRLGHGAAGGVANAGDEASIATFFEGLGDFDHLVFTAGDWGLHLAAGPIAQIDFGSASEALRVRFWGAMMAVKHALGRLAANGSITLPMGFWRTGHRKARR